MAAIPFRPSDRADSAWEPNDVLVKLYVSRSFSAALDAFSSDLKLSKSLVVRETLRRGLPAVVNDVRYLEAAGYQPSTHLSGMVSDASRRGSRGEGAVAARWAVTPPAAPSGSRPAGGGSSSSAEKDVP